MHTFKPFKAYQLVQILGFMSSRPVLVLDKVNADLLRVCMPWNFWLENRYLAGSTFCPYIFSLGVTSATYVSLALFLRRFRTHLKARPSFERNTKQCLQSCCCCFCGCSCFFRNQKFNVFRHNLSTGALHRWRFIYLSHMKSRSHHWYRACSCLLTIRIVTRCRGMSETLLENH